MQATNHKQEILDYTHTIAYLLQHSGDCALSNSKLSDGLIRR